MKRSDAAPKKRRWTPGDTVLLAELAAGKTLREAADAAKVSTDTATRRLKDPDFVERLREARAEAVSVLLGQLMKRATQAIEALDDLLLKHQPAYVRHSAARSILELAHTWREHAELAVEVEALRAEVAELKAAPIRSLPRERDADGDAA